MPLNCPQDLSFILYLWKFVNKTTKNAEYFLLDCFLLQARKKGLRFLFLFFAEPIQYKLHVLRKKDAEFLMTIEINSIQRKTGRFSLETETISRVAKCFVMKIEEIVIFFSLKGNFVSKKIEISETDLKFHLDYKMENLRKAENSKKEEISPVPHDF